MKKIIVLIFLLVVFSYGKAYAVTVSQQWDRTYGNGFTVFTAIQQTMDGGYVVAGFDFDFDFLILKLDYNGDILWKNYFGINDRGDVPLSIQQTVDGGYIVAGWSTAPPGGYYLVDIAVMKLDSAGDLVWHKRYEGSDYDSHVSIRQTLDGGYIMLGYSDSFGGEQIFVTKLEDDGDIVWQRAYDNFSEPPHSETALPIEQTSDGGYILVADDHVVKLDYNGLCVWSKVYGVSINHVEQTIDGGYIVAGCGNGAYGSLDFIIMKLDSEGNIAWQKTFGGGGYDCATSIKQASDGRYIVVGRSSSFGGGTNLWILELDSTGNVSWQKIYQGRNSDYNPKVAITSDNGCLIGTTFTNEQNDWFLWILKVDSSGEIPGCDVFATTDAIVANTSFVAQDVACSTWISDLTIADSDAIQNNPFLVIDQLCQYENPTDIDGDGVVNNTGEMMASNMSGNSFLSEVDNCSTVPNGPFLGTCIEGNIWDSCIADGACGPGGLCSMNQQDTYPPQGNGIGDACECEGNFDCSEDRNVDGSDAALFKTDFGRNSFHSACTATDPCNGDFDCDSDCDGTDAALFKIDFGRNSMSNPCPMCMEVAEWCNY